MRNFHACPDTELAAVCDGNPRRLAEVLAFYPGVEGICDFERLCDRPDIDAVAIATPVQSHAPMAIAALRAGKHVLVEKPLAGSVREAERIVRTAEDTGRVLMVDHTYIYSGA